MTTPTTLTLLLVTLSHHASAQYQTLNEHHDIHSPLKASKTIIIIVVVGMIFMLGCLCIYICHCSEPHISRTLTEPRISRTLTTSFVRIDQPQGLHFEAISALPTFQYSQVKNHKIGKRALECAVCLSEFEDHDTLRLLPQCNHVFHVDCIDSWLESHATCPVCRTDLVSKPGETYTDLTFEPNEPLTIDVIRPPFVSTSRGIFRDGSQILWSTALRIGRFFPRSHSTGHSLVQHGGDVERFTLVLPEDLRSELMKTTLKRTRSCQFDFPKMHSPKNGFKAEEWQGCKGIHIL